VARFGVRSGSVVFARLDKKPANRQFERTEANRSQRSLALAMPKATGSSPVIRFHRRPRSGGFLVWETPSPPATVLASGRQRAPAATIRPRSACERLRSLPPLIVDFALRGAQLCLRSAVPRSAGGFRLSAFYGLSRDVAGAGVVPTAARPAAGPSSASRTVPTSTSSENGFGTTASAAASGITLASAYPDM
jgi:hypothetical protein